MIQTCLTSPMDQGLGAIDIALQFGDYSELELARIGEAARIVMEFALEQPDQDPAQWADHTLSYIGPDGIVTNSRVRKKADFARILLDKGLLVSDEELVSGTIDNGLIRPGRSC